MLLIFFQLTFNTIKKIPVNTYKLTATKRNKVFNYKQTVKSIDLDEGQLLNDDISHCRCENSEFYDTGDMRLTDIKNQELRKLFTKGLNFRSHSP